MFCKKNCLFFCPRPQAWNFIEKEAPAQVFSCEFSEISKNTFFTEHLRTTASESYCKRKIDHNFHYRQGLSYIEKKQNNTKQKKTTHI